MLKPSRKHSPKRLRAFIHRHLISIVVIIVAMGATGGVLYFHTSNVNAEINKTQAASTKSATDMDKKIAAIKAKKAELARIAAEKAAAEKKAAEEAAAKLAAEQAAQQKEAAAIAINSASCNRGTTHINPASIDVVVNKKHCMQPLSYVPGDLLSSRGATLSAKAMPSFNAMMAAADAAGQTMSITSSFRSYNDQVSTYAYWVNTSGVAGADTYSARPGYSEHQTGFVFDVAAPGCVLDCFGTTAQYAWMQANAADYGFIQRYYAGYDDITGYKAEEWHYRYVGVAIAKDMKARGVKTLEQYWNISGGYYF